jgi:hypothetical protein
MAKLLGVNMTFCLDKLNLFNAIPLHSIIFSAVKMLKGLSTLLSLYSPDRWDR